MWDNENSMTLTPSIKELKYLCFRLLSIEWIQTFRF